MYKPSLQLWYFSFQKQISNVSPEINNESLHGPPGPEKWGHDRCLSDHSNNRIMYMEISDCSQDLWEVAQLLEWYKKSELSLFASRTTMKSVSDWSIQFIFIKKATINRNSTYVFNRKNSSRH